MTSLASFLSCGQHRVSKHDDYELLRLALPSVRAEGEAGTRPNDRDFRRHNRHLDEISLGLPDQGFGTYQVGVDRGRPNALHQKWQKDRSGLPGTLAMILKNNT